MQKKRPINRYNSKKGRSNTQPTFPMHLIAVADQNTPDLMLNAALSNFRTATRRLVSAPGYLAKITERNINSNKSVGSKVFGATCHFSKGLNR